MSSAQVLKHQGYQELRLSGRLARDLLDARFEALADATRVLVDYSGVTAIDLPVTAFVDLARDNDVKGMRVAVHAPTPLAFGWNRQVLQLADTREGLTVSVFRDRARAISWLLADGGNAREYGGSWRAEPPAILRTA